MKQLVIKINRLRRMPFREMIKKISVKLGLNSYYLVRKNYIAFFPIRLKENYFEGFIPNKDFIFTTNNMEEFSNEIIKEGLGNDIVHDADKICAHIFNLLGSGDKYLGKSIEWNKDFKTGFIWRNNFYKFITTENIENYADVKVPWELSRFQHIFTLGKAYWITKNEKYAQEFKDQIQDWISKNPIEMSVNWTCTMDVSIRAINWIIGYYFFNKSKSIDENFWRLFNENLYLHGLFIQNNLENTSKHTNNHYLSNLAGLIWIGLYFKNLNLESKGIENLHRLWVEFGVSEFEKEMSIQVNNDGTNYEASTSYHKLVTEIFLLTSIVCEKNNIHFSSVFSEKLEKMCEFIKNISNPNGIAPLIGDADDGRLVIFSNYSSWNRRDFSYLLSIAGEYFQRDDFRMMGINHREDSLWCFGKSVQYSTVHDHYSLVSCAYPEGGYYILRDKGINLIVRCGELSLRGQGGHSHNDQLSFTLSIDNQDLIIDPGLYVYTADYKMRNKFRSTEMHNTLEINKTEQNCFNTYELFTMREETFSECINFTENEFLGQHYGYLNKCNAIHKREITLFNRKVEIKDIVRSPDITELKDLKVYSYLHFPNEVDVLQENDKYFVKSNTNKKFELSLYNYQEITLEKYFYSNQYGELIEGKYIKALIEDINETSIISIELA